MRKAIRLNEDIRGVTDLRDSLAQVVDRVVETKRPMIITKRSRPVAAIVDIDELQTLYDLAERLEALEVKQIVDEFEAAEPRADRQSGSWTSDEVSLPTRTNSRVQGLLPSQRRPAHKRHYHNHTSRSA